MSGEQPRQPKDLKGLLKFCVEATRSEDAPPLPENPEQFLEEMDPQRKQWLEEALKGMSVDIVEQLTNGIKILMSDSVDLEEKEETLDCLEDWLGNIDTANNFHKIGGFASLRKCLESQYPSLRTGAAHLLAEVCQNNEYCQHNIIQDGFLEILCKQLDSDDDEACRVKALYSISCVCRDYPAGLEAFSKLDGWSIVVRAILSPINKLRIKGCFFLGAACKEDKSIIDQLSKMGLVQQLVSLLQEPLSLTHEHVLSLLVTMIKDSQFAKSDAVDPAIGMERILSERLKEAQGRDEFNESVEHLTQLMKLCCKEEDTTDR